MSTQHPRNVKLVPEGLSIDNQVVPLYAAAVHYFRLDPEEWHACLSAVKAMGPKLIDVYVPWATHEIRPGVFDFGEQDPRRDVAGFMKMAHELGLYVIFRPGPHINAEMTYFGIPERVIWDGNCQARSPRQHPVILPMLPLGFPVPSYASDAFSDEVARYFHALGPVLSPLLYPNGPIVLIQVDNEGALYFRDGLYDQDYHPDAILHYRAFLRQKYKTVEALPPAYSRRIARNEKGPDAAASQSTSQPTSDTLDAKSPSDAAINASQSKTQLPADLRFASLDPPMRFDGTSLDDLVVHLDWAEAQEDMLTAAFARFKKALEDAGFSGLPTMHNLPPGEEATPLSAAVVSRAVDLVGLDYYYQAGPSGRAVIARRTGELAAHCELKGVPPYACEMGVGFPPFFPPLLERDSIFTILSALAWGLRGMSLYMAVERDRWIGAPIDRHGRNRPFAAFFHKLFEILNETNFHSLRRRVPVRVVIPRHERRLTRALHAFGPFPGTAFAIANSGARERTIEDNFDAGRPIGIEVDTFIRAFEQALDARGVPFSIVEAFDKELPAGDAKWLVYASSGGISADLFDVLCAAQNNGVAISFGPQKPEFDSSLRPHSTALAWYAMNETLHDVPLFIDETPAAVDNAVARAIESLGLPTCACDPHGLLSTIHEDAAGTPRVLFVVNPTDNDVMGRFSIAGAAKGIARDLFGDEQLPIEHGAIETRIPGKTVRMFAIEKD
ncbi:MAG: beta-galactosidase [Polyangiaceae bacterium]|nr:beta-galactosidase [Polyangiaceae bacterium]